MGLTRTRTKRPRAHLYLEQLENRLVPAGLEPTAVEQLMLEQLNDARANPAAYGASIGLDLTGVAPSQPLAFDPRLISSARGHSQDMAVNNYFAHNSLAGVDPGQRMLNEGFAWSSWGESIAAGYGSTGEALAGLIIDTGVADLGHRRHLLAMDQVFKTQSAVGVGVVLNGPGAYHNYYTIDSATPTDTRPYLTGVVYNDLNHNGKYDVGEGLGAVSVVVQGVAATSTWGSGGYTIQLNPGTYTVTVSGGSFGAAYTTTVSIGAQNVRLPVIQGVSQAQQDANYQFVRNLYQSYLKRPASPTEVSLFGGYLNGGQATPASLTAMVQTSQEYANVCTVWLHQAYKDMLGRDAGAGEIGNWLAWLRTPGATMDAAGYTIVSSGEAHIRQWTGWVQAAYQGYLRRSAGANEVAAWASQFQAGMTRDGLTAAVLSSGEYLGRFSTNTQFVTAMYRDVLGRTGATTEITGWVNLLQSGTTRAAVVAGFVGSFEFHWRTYSQSVSQLYQGCLGRPAGSAEVNVLATALISGTPLEVIETSVLSSQEYYNRAVANG